jgi:single-stranded-DNA-specific exonuclease
MGSIGNLMSAAASPPPGIRVHPVIKGQHVHQPELIKIIQGYAPSLLIVLDQGSRGGAIVPGLPTLVIDHHKPEGFPEGATVRHWG